MKKWLLFVAIAAILLIVAVLFSYNSVESFSDPYITSDLDNLPKAKVAVILGTSTYLTNGNKNLYFVYRMDAAEELYKSGKVEYILVSGDNRHKEYNEPIAMQKALLDRGIPEDRIVLDYAGFRTLDSMIRAKDVFGQSQFIVVSQRFHNERAVYIARHREIQATGYNARDVNVSAGFKTQLREVLARVKMMLDLYILKTEPHFLGEKIVIGA